MKNNKLLREKEDIVAWLNQYEIKDYELLEDGFYGYVVNVDGNVSLRNKKLTRIAVKFNMIKGYFDCYNNQLVSLKGCPNKVGGSFYCYNNQLTSLEHCPKEVGGGFDCSHNQLTSLEHCPKEIGEGFYCYNNQLRTLEHCPKEVGGSFYCSHNQLVSLEGCSKEVVGSFSCSDNQLTTLKLKDLPEIIGESIHLDNNPLLGKFQEIADFNELKNILIIQEEQQLLHSTIECNKTNSNILKL